MNVEKVVEDKTKCHLNYEQRCLNLAKKEEASTKENIGAHYTQNRKINFQNNCFFFFQENRLSVNYIGMFKYYFY